LSGKNIILSGKCQGILSQLECGNPEVNAGDIYFLPTFIIDSVERK